MYICRNPRRAKLNRYHELKPSKCQMKLCVETITPHVEVNSRQAEQEPNSFQPNNLPKASTPGTEKPPPHSIKISPDKLRRLSNSKRVKKRKSASPSKEKKMKTGEDKAEEAKFQEEADKSGKEDMKAVEGKPLQDSAVTNGKKTGVK